MGYVMGLRIALAQRLSVGSIPTYSTKIMLDNVKRMSYKNNDAGVSFLRGS